MVRWRLVIVVLLIGGFFGGSYFLAEAHRSSAERFDIFLAVYFFAHHFGRMPNSFDELVKWGYLRPVRENGRRGYRLYHAAHSYAPPISAKAVSASPLYIYHTSGIDFAWGCKPQDLILREGRLYYRDKPEKEAILVRYRTLWVGRLTRLRSLGLYKAMLEGAARRSAQSAPTTRSAAPGQGKMLEDGGTSSLDGATQR